MLTITPKAAEKIQDFMKSEDSNKGKSLRLKVAPSGCAGYEYKIAFDEKGADRQSPAPERLRRDHRPRVACLLVESATIDYAEDETSSGFRIKNPIEKGSCGCGKSKQF